MKKSFILVAVAALLAACDTTQNTRSAPPEAPPPPQQQQSSEPSHNAQSPMVVKVRGPESVQPGSKIELTVTIERRLVDNNPLKLAIQLPQGASLLEGVADEQIVDGRSPTLTRKISISIGAVPASDVLVSVDVRGAGYGVHATDSYRFGRPEPKLPQPLDRAVKLPGIPGTPIPMGH